MLRSFTNERLIRDFFLGELPETERERVQERLFTDPEFFEELLIIEDELTDAYALNLFSDHEQEKFERHYLTAPPQYQKLEFARALDRYVTGTQGRTTSQAVDYETVAGPVKTNASFISRLFSLIFRRKPAQTVSQNIGTTAEQNLEIRNRLLAEAQANRDLLAALTEKDWLGLYLLTRLRSSSPLTMTEFASELEVESPEIRPVLTRLIECGLVSEDQGEFSCTQLGITILAQTEEMTGAGLDS